MFLVDLLCGYIMIYGIIIFLIITLISNVIYLFIPKKKAVLSPEKPVKPFEAIDTSNLIHHTRFASKCMDDEQYRIFEVFKANNMPYTTKEIYQGTSMTRIVYTLNNIKDYSRIGRLEKQFQAAIGTNKASLSIDGPNVNIDLPTYHDTLYLGDMLTQPEYINSVNHTIPIGRTAYNEYVFDDIENLKHILVAGASGSGKSVWVQGVILSLLAKHDDIDIYMIDPKIVEFGRYANIPHCKVVTQVHEAFMLLSDLCIDMNKRYAQIAAAGARDITGVPGMRRKIVIVDELADLMCSGLKKEIEQSIVRLAQKARACGIHLVLATQYPKSDIVTGLIKTNMPTKVCFAVPSSTASCVMIGKGGAEKLIGKGDMLYQTEKDIHPRRLQGAMVTDNDIAYILNRRM